MVQNTDGFSTDPEAAAEAVAPVPGVRRSRRLPLTQAKVDGESGDALVPRARPGHRLRRS